MKVLRILLFYTVFLGSVSFCWAQQLSQFVHFQKALLYYNPAIAGSQEYIESTVISQRQFRSFQTNPSSYLFAAHKSFKFNRLGLGAYVHSNRFDKITYSSFNVAYTYKINVSRGILSFGIDGGIGQYRYAISKNAIKDEDDYLATESFNSMVPELSSGLLLKTKRMIIGFSSKHMLHRNLAQTNSFLFMQRHWVFHYSFKIPINKRWTIEPTVLARKPQNSTPLMSDVGIDIHWFDRIGGGLYANSASMIALKGYFKAMNTLGPDNHLLIFYSYNVYSANKPMNANIHEIALQIHLDKLPDKNKILKREKKSQPVLTN